MNGPKTIPCGDCRYYVDAPMGTAPESGQCLCDDIARPVDPWSTCEAAEKKTASFKPGDKVRIVGDCYEAEKYAGQVWTVASPPWEVSGNEIVLLHGKAGGFSTRFLELVEAVT